MSNEAIGSWIKKAKLLDVAELPLEGIMVIRRDPKQSRGNLILELAELMRPCLVKMFEGIRDENGMLVQPARVRAVALNLAHRMVKAEEQKKSG